MPIPTATSTQSPVACAAPPLTDEKLAAYKSLIAKLDPGELKDNLDELFKCVVVWWELPESKAKPPTRWLTRNVSSGKDEQWIEQPLDAEHVKALDAATPYTRELATLSNADGTGLLDLIPVDSELRNPAFHLLWYCLELSLDREPMTMDKITK